MAGRSKEKLEELRSQLDPKCAQTPILTAELNDAKALDKLVKQADVIISTAGPFWNIGNEMVRRLSPFVPFPHIQLIDLPSYLLRLLSTAATI